MSVDLSEVIEDMASPYTIKSVSQTTVDFVKTPVVVPRTINALIQPAEKRKLNPDTIDWSLKYILIHSLEAVNMGEYIVYEGEDYKITSGGDWLPYGYVESIGEQTKRPLIEVTP